jgi:predicted nucleic acid-binding protein
MKQRIYIDTSVVGGYFDEEFKEATIKLFERLDNNEIIFVVSDLLDLELINAPQQVREHLLKYSADKFQRVELTEEAIKLANTYIDEKVVGKTSLEDCRHIALATIHKVDVLASWNFKHIVNLDRIKGYNSVNLRLGYSMIEIRSPKDLVNYGND